MTWAPLIPWGQIAILGAAMTLLAGIGLRRAGRMHSWPWLRRLLMVGSLVLMLANPVVGTQRTRAAAVDLDVVVAVDTTSSIAAEDMPEGKTRLAVIKQDLAQLTEELAGARFSVVTFDREPVRVMPFTTDTTAVTSAVDVVTPETTFYSRGSQIDVAREYLEEILLDAKKRNPAHARVLVYMGDGEQTSDKKVVGFANLRPHLSGGAVIGYGTTRGGRMRETNPYLDEKEFIKDRSGDEFPPPDAISRIDESNLRRIADDIGASYTKSSGRSEVQAIATKLREKAASDVQLREKTSSGRQLYWTAALLLCLLASVEVGLAYEGWRDLRVLNREGGAE